MIALVKNLTGIILTQDLITSYKRRAPVENCVPLTIETAALFKVLKKHFISGSMIDPSKLFTKATLLSGNHFIEDPKYTDSP